MIQVLIGPSLFFETPIEPYQGILKAKVFYQNGLASGAYKTNKILVSWNPDSPQEEIATAISHEVGHIMTISNIDGKRFYNSVSQLTSEIFAWRAAKMIIKAGLWDQKMAEVSLRSYFAWYYPGKEERGLFLFPPLPKHRLKAIPEEVAANKYVKLYIKEEFLEG